MLEIAREFKLTHSLLFGRDFFLAYLETALIPHPN